MTTIAERTSLAEAPATFRYRTCPVTARPGEAEGIAKIQQLLG